MIPTHCLSTTATAARATTSLRRMEVRIPLSTSSLRRSRRSSRKCSSMPGSARSTALPVKQAGSDEDSVVQVILVESLAASPKTTLPSPKPPVQEATEAIAAILFPPTRPHYHLSSQTHSTQNPRPHPFSTCRQQPTDQPSTTRSPRQPPIPFLSLTALPSHPAARPALHASGNTSPSSKTPLRRLRGPNAGAASCTLRTRLHRLRRTRPRCWRRRGGGSRG